MAMQTGGTRRRALVTGASYGIGAAVRYLASPDASYITGQILLLDGGLTAH